MKIETATKTDRTGNYKTNTIYRILLDAIIYLYWYQLLLVNFLDSSKQSINEGRLVNSN